VALEPSLMKPTLTCHLILMRPLKPSLLLENQQWGLESVCTFLFKGKFEVVEILTRTFGTVAAQKPKGENSK